MASIPLSVVGGIDYLAYGAIFTRVTHRPKKKGDVFFPARKAVDARWGVVMFRRSLPAQLEGGKHSNAKKMKKNSTAQVLDQQLLVHRLSKPVYD